jgi:hypothetical protein
MVFRKLSPRVRRRFPKMENLIEAGFLNENELKVIQDLEAKYPGYLKNWLPICWAANLATRARDEGRIHDDFALKTIIDELNHVRGRLGTLMNYAAVCIPLVYVQVVTVAVYTYFLTSLLAEQPLFNKESFIAASNTTTLMVPSEVNMFSIVPLLTIIEFILYMGWLKVAETMINPFGDDDDDFDLNSIIDGNLIVSYLIVDEMHNEHPELLKDQYWKEIPKSLPDRTRDENKEDSKNKTDIFDVQEPQPSGKQRTSILQINADVESPSPIFASSSPHENLKPRSSVIDETYKNLSNIDTTQSAIQREMRRNREKKFMTRSNESSLDEFYDSSMDEK